MRLLSSAEVRVAPAASAEGSSEIAIEDRSATVSGLVLEAAAHLADEDPIAGYLFFLTDDVPYEDTLSITLTDPTLRPLDQARLGGIYATGAWRDPALEGPGRISFRFIDQKRWMLTVLPAPAIRLTLPGEPRGVHRPWGLSRHFTLSAQ